MRSVNECPCVRVCRYICVCMGWEWEGCLANVWAKHLSESWREAGVRQQRRLGGGEGKAGIQAPCLSLAAGMYPRVSGLLCCPHTSRRSLCSWPPNKPSISCLHTFAYAAPVCSLLIWWIPVLISLPLQSLPRTPNPRWPFTFPAPYHLFCTSVSHVSLWMFTQNRHNI